jgi:hypothetical protein
MIGISGVGDREPETFMMVGVEDISLRRESKCGEDREKKGQV